MDSEKLTFSLAIVVLIALCSATTAIHRFVNPPLAALAPVIVQSQTRILIPTSTPAPTPTPRPTKRPGVVTLKAAPGNTQVQMFGSIYSGGGTVTRFRTGTECVKLDGPMRITEGGVSMSFYKLTCNGRTGYVNTKWVRN